MRLLRIIAWLAIGPAVYVNIEATPMPWTPFAVASVIFAAVCVLLAQQRRSFWLGTLGAIFTSINLATALGNVANMTADTVDGRASIIQRREAVNGRRAALNEARKAQKAIAGETAPAVFESQIMTLIASDATRYAASEHCSPDKTSRPETKDFCAEIGRLETKKAAALERVRIDAQLGEVDKETLFGGPSAADPYAESLARFLSMFGFQFSEDGKALLSSSKDWGRAIGLELMAAFGPMVLTLFFEMLLAPVPAPASGEGRALVEREPAPAPSIPLAAVPHVEAAPIATLMEPDEDQPAPLPPPPRKLIARRKPGVTSSGPGAVVLPFKRREINEVLTLLSAGKTQKDVADILGIGLRTVGRIVAASKTSQMDSNLAAS